MFDIIFFLLSKDLFPYFFIYLMLKHSMTILNYLNKYIYSDYYFYDLKLLYNNIFTKKNKSIVKTCVFYFHSTLFLALASQIAHHLHNKIHLTSYFKECSY